MADPPKDRDGRPEIEIIQPEREPPRESGARIFVSIGRRDRVHFARLGWLGTILVLLLVGLVVALVLVFVLGTFLIIVPAVIVMMVLLLALGLVRTTFGARGGRPPTD